MRSSYIAQIGLQLLGSYHTWFVIFLFCWFINIIFFLVFLRLDFGPIISWDGILNHYQPSAFLLLKHVHPF
jgi:uncharacterized membrane protein